MRFRRVAVLALLLILVMQNLPLGASRSSGISDVERGCFCHSSSATSSVSITLDGLPNRYQSNTTYTLNISVTGGAEPRSNPPPENIGGFNLWMQRGDFVNLSIEVQEIKPNQLTHTGDGNDQRIWAVNWTSPEDDSLNVDWRLTVNTVNGDGSNSDNDQWNQISGTVIGVNGTVEEVVSPLLLYGIPIGLILTSWFVFLSVTRGKTVSSAEEE